MTVTVRSTTRSTTAHLGNENCATGWLPADLSTPPPPTRPGPVRVGPGRPCGPAPVPRPVATHRHRGHRRQKGHSVDARERGDVWCVDHATQETPQRREEHVPPSLRRQPSSSAAIDDKQVTQDQRLARTEIRGERQGRDQLRQPKPRCGVTDHTEGVPGFRRAGTRAPRPAMQGLCSRRQPP